MPKIKLTNAFCASASGCFPGMKSPCNQICEIDGPSGFCTGCGRSLAEIEEWSAAPDSRQRQILAALPARIAAFGARRRSDDVGEG